MTSKSGFTLVEVMLSVALLGAVTSLTAPVWLSMQSRNSLDIAATHIVHSLRRAGALSRAVAGDSSWGVAIDAERLTLFRGATYASRDIAFDETFDFDWGVVSTGLSEVVLEKVTGRPSTTGTITLSTSSHDTRIITINDQAMLEY